VSNDKCWNPSLTSIRRVGEQCPTPKRRDPYSPYLLPLRLPDLSLAPQFGWGDRVVSVVCLIFKKTRVGHGETRALHKEDRPKTWDEISNDDSSGDYDDDSDFPSSSDDDSDGGGSDDYRDESGLSIE